MASSWTDRWLVNWGDNSPGDDVHVLLFLCRGAWWNPLFFLAVFEVDENSEKKPLNRCIFFLPLAGGDLAEKVGGVFFFRLQADPRGFGLEVADACFSCLEHPWTRMYVWWFLGYSNIDSSIIYSWALFQLMNFCFVSKSASVGHFWADWSFKSFSWGLFCVPRWHWTHGFLVMTVMTRRAETGHGHMSSFL